MQSILIKEAQMLIYMKIRMQSKEHLAQLYTDQFKEPQAENN